MLPTRQGEMPKKRTAHPASSVWDSSLKNCQEMLKIVLTTQVTVYDYDNHSNTGIIKLKMCNRLRSGK